MAAIVQDLDVIVLLVVPEKMYSLVIEQDAMESLGQLGKEIIKFINLETSIFEIGLSFQKINFFEIEYFLHNLSVVVDVVPQLCALLSGHV